MILGGGTTPGSNDTTLTATAKYSINLAQLLIKFVLSLPYNESNSFLFENATKIYKFKSKNSEIKDYTQWLGDISKDFTINNMKKRQG